MDAFISIPTDGKEIVPLLHSFMDLRNGFMVLNIANQILDHQNFCISGRKKKLGFIHVSLKSLKI